MTFLPLCQWMDIGFRYSPQTSLKRSRSQGSSRSTSWRLATPSSRGWCCCTPLERSVGFLWNICDYNYHRGIMKHSYILTGTTYKWHGNLYVVRIYVTDWSCHRFVIIPMEVQSSGRHALYVAQIARQACAKLLVVSKLLRVRMTRAAMTEPIRMYTSTHKDRPCSSHE